MFLYKLFTTWLLGASTCFVNFVLILFFICAIMGIRLNLVWGMDVMDSA